MKLIPFLTKIVIAPHGITVTKNHKNRKVFF